MYAELLNWAADTDEKVAVARTAATVVAPGGSGGASRGGGGAGSTTVVVEADAVTCNTRLAHPSIRQS
eukprot:1195756-Prorocentrum_minimum.AAC.5